MGILYITPSSLRAPIIINHHQSTIVDRDARADEMRRTTTRLYTVAAASSRAASSASVHTVAVHTVVFKAPTIGCRRGAPRTTTTTTTTTTRAPWMCATTTSVTMRGALAGVCTSAGAREAASGGSTARDGDDEGDARREDGEDVDDEGAVDGRTRTGRNKKSVFKVPDEVPMSPPHYRTLLVKCDDDVALACAATCAEATALARERMATGGYPPGSRQLRIIMPKIKTAEDAQAVIDLMAMAHEHRTARYATGAGAFPKFNELAFLDLLRALWEIQDIERTAWVIENVNLLGGKMTKTIAKQGFYGVFKGPFEYTYRVYDATRESFGSYFFASQSVIMVALNNGLVDMAKEYAVAFKESGAVVPNKALLRFLLVGVNTGDVETAQFGYDHYVDGIASLNEYKIGRVKARNAKIESGEEEGNISEISESWLDSKPRSPFFYSMTACMHVLKGDVPAATEALNNLVSIKFVAENRDDATSPEENVLQTKANVIEMLEKWPATLYGNGYDAKPRDELRDALKSAIAGVTDAFVKDLLSTFDVDDAFVEKVDATASEASSE